MAKISLKTITDDILLLVRNNNISESEDLSRALIHTWVKAYRHKLWKDEKDRRKELGKFGKIEWEELADDEYIRLVETGPMELEVVPPKCDSDISVVKRTVDKLENVLNNDESSILAVHDENGENIQYMNHVRRNYMYWRRYVFGDMTAYYRDDGHLYVEGLVDEGNLKYVYVLWLKEIDEDEDEDDDSEEDDIKIPAWMVPMIKKLIIENELAFMLNRQSDDDNNSTLASVKPKGPLDDEK